jgi:hypothetical protein
MSTEPNITHYFSMTITQTDKAVIIACVTSFATFLINAKLGSTWLLYLNVLVVVGVLGYASRKWDESSLLSRSVIFGVIASITTYIPLDWLFSRRVVLLSYLSRHDIRIAAVPLSLLLTWALAITIIIYLYQRLDSIWGRPYIPAVVAGGVAFVGSTLFDQLGSARLWNWNATPLSYFPYIGSVPVFVPMALGLTFLLSPYYLRSHYIIVGGIRCGLFIGIMQFFCFLLFHFIGISR